MRPDGLSGLRLTSDEEGEPPEVPPDTKRTDVLEMLAGATFEGGLYRLHNRASATALRPTVELAFPAHRGQIWLFGFDWLGRQFALDASRTKGKEPLVLLLEPGTGEALEIPATLAEFHESTLIHETEAALAESFFRTWRSNAPNGSLDHSQCAGYRVPLFLGGRDEVDNLEVTGLAVYWGLLAQLIRRVSGLPVGTRIDGLSITDEP
jgi:Domain of unknown function (DUF1851)